MPELAEVEHSRRQWNTGLQQAVTRVHLRPVTRVFRGVDTTQLLKGVLDPVKEAAKLKDKQVWQSAAAKQGSPVRSIMLGSLSQPLL